MGREEMLARFEKLKHLDSSVLIEIPQPEIVVPEEYRHWFMNLEYEWMRDFNGNEHYCGHDNWDEEDGIGGKFGDEFIDHSKYYRQDGTYEPWGKKDWRSKRGVQIRDHYDLWDVVKTQIIADNLVSFLKKNGIAHKKFNFSRTSRDLIECA